MIVKALSQRDPKWASELLGFNANTYTIGGYGCLITCLTMVCNYYGKFETPSTINKKLKDTKGFSAGNGFYIWGSIEKIFPDISEEWIGRFPDPLSNSQMELIKSSVKSGYPIMVEIDFQPETAQPDMHFVLITDFDPNDENNFTIVDPWTGSIGSLKMYLKASKPTARLSIQQIIIYKGQIPQPITTNYEDKLKEVMQNLIDMRTSRDRWERMFNELSDKVAKDTQTSNEQIRLLQSTIGEQNAQVMEMNKSILSLTQENKRLSSQIQTLQGDLKSSMSLKDTETIRADKFEKKYNDLKAAGKKFWEFWK
jgi:uncharacterized protein YvpB